MALCALGLVSGDATLAGAALGELMKRKNGSDGLTGDICYLYSRFYALQGNQKLGRSHIMKEIHRNPASSLLWSQLASYLLQACPDEQEAAACCSESSARLGGTQSRIHPAGIVGSGALRNHIRKPSLKSVTNRTRSGLIASQKAVHAHPDHVTSWAVLAASVTAHNISTSREGLGTEKNGLGTRISQFVESAASQEKVKSLSEHQLLALVEARTSHLETLQSWAIIHRGYCLLYSGLHQEAAKHVDQFVICVQLDSANLRSTALLESSGVTASGEPVQIGLNLLQTSLLSSPSSFTGMPGR
ncbi:Tetratricopeptide repeat protein 37 [Desmophyllum pertusum]|uniref:Tetratricopeptide repeat protein 37 n=1 Tax=Desmophyllum pertusum TaxID=174260 RepID=A0A9W9YUZ6_9CNID|nr:Tetratricopeptide repeat protein 37 [Desmophyllum pertusum]